MGFFFALLILSFFVILVSNAAWIVLNAISIMTIGIQSILRADTFVENIYFSTFLKWIILADVLWIISFLGFVSKRKHYKTNPKLHHLSYNPIDKPKICVIIPAYNEELTIEHVIKDYINQKYVKDVLVIDNHSSDKTVEIAKQCGATVITKKTNMGINHSYHVGLNESLKTDSNIIVLTEADGTYSGYDLQKMIPYLDNCDVVVGSRQAQVLTEKGNQNTLMHTWGNYIVAKLLQIKYLTIRHFGVILLTDIGCSYRCIRREGLEKIVDKITFPGTDKVIVSSESGLFIVLFTILGIENDLKSVEVPVTFKKRMGSSKTRSGEKIQGFRYGLNFIWFILWR